MCIENTLPTIPKLVQFEDYKTATKLIQTLHIQNKKPKSVLFFFTFTFFIENVFFGL